jgi:hypothetical protein
MDESTIQVVLFLIIVAILVFGGILFFAQIGKGLNKP